MTELWGALIAVAVGLAIVWIALLIALAVTRPKDLSVADALRLLPDTMVLMRRLAADPQQPRGVRVRLLLLLVYLILPFDLIPDFIPFLGYADDAIVVAVALRSVARRAGYGALEKHWPGTPEGLQSVRRLAGIPSPETGEPLDR
jgi:uncharacterized membrane protein YkvA (DUF1232 family)